jgi:hypothetical protein
VTFALRGADGRLLACPIVSRHPAANQQHDAQPLSTGQRVIESLAIVLLALMAFLLALK